jgi:hypothetical protein
MYIINGYLYARWWSENSGFAGDEIIAPVSADTIYYAVSAYNNPGNYTLYLNGQMIDTRVSSSEIRSHAGDGGIGYTGPTTKDFHDLMASGGHYFLGTIYDVKVGDFYMDEEMANQSYSMIFEEPSTTSYASEENFTAFSVPISQEGNYKWNVKCNDTVGYDSFGLENYTFIMDVTDPQVLFGAQTEADGETVGSDWVFIDTNVIENNFENITFGLWNSSQQVAGITFSDDTRSYNFTGLSSGTYYYNVTVYDKAGRSGSSPTRSINLDLSPPTGNLGTPSDGSYVNNLVQNLTASFNDATGLLNATLYVLNETGHLIYSEAVSLGGALSTTIGVVYNFVKEGIYSWLYEVEDLVGNKVNTTSNEIIVHITPPSVEYSDGVESSGTIFERENIYVNVTADDEYFANVTFDLYDSDSHVFAHTFTDGTTDINWTLLPDEVYEYNVTVYDLAGNFNSTETRNITLDNLNPVIDFGSGTLPTASYVSGDTVSFDVVVTEANEDNITFKLYNDEGINVRSTTDYSARRSISWNLLSEGVYHYNSTIYDEVGHVASTGTRSIEIDDTLPVVSFGFGTKEDGSSFSRDWIYFRATIVEDNFKNVTFELWNSTQQVAGSTFSDTTRDVNYTGLSDGVYYYNITSYDKAGNKGVSSTRAIILDSEAPEISFAGTTEIDNFNKTEDWIFAEVNLVEDNFESITYALRDVSGVVNSTTYVTAVININW